MIFKHTNPPFETKQSIIVAGIQATGKSYLIKMLQKHLDAPLVHREVAELKGVPIDSIIHWPIAEKDRLAKKVDYKNTGLVLLLNKCWGDYCTNVRRRNSKKQYSVLGFKEICGQWTDFFKERDVPILNVPTNDPNITQLLQQMSDAMKPKLFL